MTINTSHANITGGITNDILNILDITDSRYTIIISSSSIITSSYTLYNLSL